MSDLMNDILMKISKNDDQCSVEVYGLKFKKNVQSINGKTINDEYFKEFISKTLNKCKEDQNG